MEKAIWFDFENAPHVWVLKPIYEYFKEKGYRCYCSARDFSYTLSLLKLADIKASVQKGFVSTNKILKTLGVILRTISLVNAYKGKKIDLAISHGSRSQILAAKILGIPAISLDDYEKSNQFLVRFTCKTLVPCVINKSNWGRYQKKIEHYPGLKEHIYLFNYNFDETIFEKLKLDRSSIIILLRPEAPTSHYYNRKSTRLLWLILRYISKSPNVSVIFLPRNKRQQNEVSRFFNIKKIKYLIPKSEDFGFEIITTADLVIGGGGTMLREAACLGIPAYSYFSGLWGDVDNYLLSIGRLIKIENRQDIEKIKIIKRNNKLTPVHSEAKKYIIKYIENFLYAGQSN